MKKIPFLIVYSIFLSTNIIHAQCTEIPKLIDGEYHGCGHTVSLTNLAGKAEYIIEGRILTDSTFFLAKYHQDIKFFLYRVLVLKEFKGDYKSDTIEVICNIINGDDGGEKFAYIGDEAIFLLSRGEDINDKASYGPIDGDGWGFIRVCGRKDIVKDIYKPLEKIIGQKYIEVHPNTCATQKKEK
jgi:hypothetical protein